MIVGLVYGITVVSPSSCLNSIKHNFLLPRLSLILFYFTLVYSMTRMFRSALLFSVIKTRFFFCLIYGYMKNEVFRKLLFHVDNKTLYMQLLVAIPPNYQQNIVIVNNATIHQITLLIFNVMFILICNYELLCNQGIT